MFPLGHEKLKLALASSVAWLLAAKRPNFFWGPFELSFRNLLFLNGFSKPGTTNLRSIVTLPSQNNSSNFDLPSQIISIYRRKTFRSTVANHFDLPSQIISIYRRRTFRSTVAKYFANNSNFDLPSQKHFDLPSQN